ncbi:uncharacterized protein PHACADRAFT_262150 [Phanerochaete carnosa HHB-10118-sp]|uniref:F-box domain-containing protein n=1 Tax=Phanerochaete carnosa (strain HHB-10118-sp) TaxID=650164 RepID=K5WNE3_PHACS|nr:uncharacterized protein PHACADRAFT_262150 [Phanerochaete carnosa HHB-10118-sp]EKM51807.1 hypothetical protein PHACADRAFT_262150 [Phanerochaete carnosa HHB-10118-sp]
MSSAAGADLPPETLSSILGCITPTYVTSDLDARRRLKHTLIAPSLVCKCWSETIRPILFQVLELRSAEDVRFLKSIVYSPQFATSSLSGAIKRIDIR